MRLIDKNKSLMNYRSNNQGAVVTKGKREVYLLFKSSNAGDVARKTVAENSFNKLFNKGKKVGALGSNKSYIKF